MALDAITNGPNTGIQGQPGPRGNTILSLDRAPQPTDGWAGDYAVDKTTQRFYGPKAEMTGWDTSTWIQLGGSSGQGSNVGISLELLGVKGDGITNDTLALNAALLTGATAGVKLLGKKGAVYLVDSIGLKSFTTGGNTVITKNAAVQIPTGCEVDFGGATIKAASTSDTVLVSNKRCTVKGDAIKVSNLVIDGGGSDRTVPMVWFWGCTNSDFLGITLRNTKYTASNFAQLDNCRFENILAEDIIGQGISIGGNTFDQCRNLTIGTLHARRIQTYGTFNQPGNGVFLGIRDSSVVRLLAENCAGGHKLGPNCANITIGQSEFDGAPTGAESSYTTANCGTKLQGEAGIPVKNISIGQVTSRNCAGSGLFITYAEDCSIGQFVGKGNATLGLDADVAILDGITGLAIDSIVSSFPGNSGINISASTGANSGHYRIGKAVVTSPGQVADATSKSGIILGGGRGVISMLHCLDIQASPTMSKGIQHTGGVANMYCRIENFHSLGAGSEPLDIRTPAVEVGSTRLSGGTAPLLGEVTLVAGTSTAIVNANVRVVAISGGGFVEPIVDLIPMNPAARAIGQVYPTFVTGTMTLNHGNATGNELFMYRLLGYTYRTAKFS